MKKKAEPVTIYAVYNRAYGENPPDLVLVQAEAVRMSRWWKLVKREYIVGFDYQQQIYFHKASETPIEALAKWREKCLEHAMMLEKEAKRWRERAAAPVKEE